MAVADRSNFVGLSVHILDCSGQYSFSSNVETALQLLTLAKCSTAFKMLVSLFKKFENRIEYGWISCRLCCFQKLSSWDLIDNTNTAHKPVVSECTKIYIYTDALEYVHRSAIQLSDGLLPILRWFMFALLTCSSIHVI